MNFVTRVFFAVERRGWLNFLSDRSYIKIMFYMNIGKKLDLKAPKTFNEKLQWLKLYDRRPEYIQLVDKYEVKKYIANQIGDKYVIPTLGVWDRFDDIDFDALPDQFVLKCTHDSGGLVICKSKAQFDKDVARKKINACLNRNYYWHGREWPYKNVKPRIIAEQYMEQNGEKDLTDYKFYCFNGEPKFLYVSVGLSNHETAQIGFLDLDWELMPMRRTDFAELTNIPPKPINFDKMVEFARELSHNIPFLRVDFYEINGKLYFGELTFYPGAGFTVLKPEEWDKTFGDWITLPPKGGRR